MRDQQRAGFWKPRSCTDTTDHHRTLYTMEVKENSTNCYNYRGITLLSRSIPGKIFTRLSKIVLERINSTVDGSTGRILETQLIYRPDWNTTDHRRTIYRMELKPHYLPRSLWIETGFWKHRSCTDKTTTQRIYRMQLVRTRLQHNGSAGWD